MGMGWEEAGWDCSVMPKTFLQSEQSHPCPPDLIDEPQIRYIKKTILSLYHSEC